MSILTWVKVKDKYEACWESCEIETRKTFCFLFFSKENSPSSQQYYLNQPQHKKITFFLSCRYFSLWKESFIIMIIILTLHPTRLLLPPRENKIKQEKRVALLIVIALEWKETLQTSSWVHTVVARSFAQEYFSYSYHIIFNRKGEENQESILVCTYIILIIWSRLILYIFYL